MEETTVSIIGMLIAAIIMFIVPLILIADRSDDISQLVIQTVTAEFVDEVIRTGKITDDSYQDFLGSLNATGNTYEVDMEVKILDENTSKIVTDRDKNEIGNNTYYSLYTSQIESIIFDGTRVNANNREGKFILKSGDAISVTVKNNSQTLSQSLKNFYYRMGGNNQIIAATASGTVVVNGATYKE